MQAIKDAGIVLVVILLAVSVRFSPLEETGQEMDIASLTPRTEAAPAPRPVEHSAPIVFTNAAAVSTPDDFSIRQWVLNTSDEIVHSAEFEAATLEQCHEVLIHIRKAAEQTHNEAIVFGAEEVVKVLPCSV